MYQNRLENIVQIIEVQNTKLLESKQKELLNPKKQLLIMKMLIITIMMKI